MINLHRFFNRASFRLSLIPLALFLKSLWS